MRPTVGSIFCREFTSFLHFGGEVCKQIRRINQIREVAAADSLQLLYLKKADTGEVGIIQKK